MNGNLWRVEGVGILGVKNSTKNFTGREKNTNLVVHLMGKILINKILNL